MSTTPAKNRAPFTLGEIAHLTGGALRGDADRRAVGVCTDTRALWEGAAFVALRGENFDAHDFLPRAADRAAVAVVARDYEAPAGLDLPLVRVDDPLRALGALARAHRDRFEIPVGAITGSNGKTTTKELAASVFQAAFGETLRTEGNLNNEIGLPLTLLGLEARHRAACVELGMNHAGEIARLTAIARPRAGLVTCAQAVHLEGLGSVEAVARAKGELYHGLPADGVAVVNADDPRMSAEAASAGRPTLRFGGAREDLDLGVSAGPILSMDKEGMRVVFRLGGGAAREVRLRLVGVHNVQNACAAMALGLALGADEEAILRGIEAARGAPRRLELRPAAGGFTVLDDCYNANPASAIAALRTARGLAGPGRLVAVLGDLLELGAQEVAGHEEVGRAAAQAEASVLVAFGPRSGAMARAARAGGVPADAILETEAPDEALAFLRTQVEAGDLVLFKASRGMRLERIADPLVEGA